MMVSARVHCDVIVNIIAQVADESVPIEYVGVIPIKFKN